jgi:DNA-directed RNA polymerase subunit F
MVLIIEASIWIKMRCDIQVNKYVPMWDVREAMYPEKMTTEQLAEAMEDLTDMQNHVLPYLQSFCSLEEKGVQERREQQIAEKRRTKWNQIS